ncbi:beta-ketoacyl synthase N-terminal-like domain-containing protein [Maribacter sp. 2304DJ31-5]|uniref:beta-ketoacyl synthase N-terminal-like domain-containing protein n=1 Tax=Maribacter sp. 2304DJ31-5 TaxID=3386273 RepID=UPI0039BC3136
MKKPVYINSIGSVSIQKTFDNSEFLEDIIPHSESCLKVVDPNYKAYLPPAAARRMAKGIKMSMVSSKTAMKEAQLSNVDAIIVGTGLGCLGDSEKFLSDIIDNNEQYLTPTRFIQSSHNTVAGQIALDMGCKGYNYTYVHATVSFESGLWDAKMQLELGEAENILVGGVDELVDHHIDTHKLIGHIKEEPQAPEELLTSVTKGNKVAEGSHFFVLSNQKRSFTYARFLGIDTFNALTPEQVPLKIEDFLKRQEMELSDMDLVVLGYNGDVEYDGYYHNLSAGILADIPQIYYKHVSGEFDTATGFAFWMANQMLRTQHIPDVLKVNGKTPEKVETILLYNQYRGKNHSIVLLQKC